MAVLAEHWGPVGRDLTASNLVWDDVCTERFPLDQFVQFVLYAPPGTSVFHVINDGWDANTHKITDLIQWVKVLISVGTEDPERAFRELGSESRPGVKAEEPQQHMTIGEYMRLAGLDGGDD